MSQQTGLTVPEFDTQTAVPVLADIAATRTPYLTIRPRRHWTSLNLSELWHFRDLLLSLAARDLKLRYKQTALGVIWVVIQPLMAAGIFSFVFGRVAKLPSDGVPYLLFSFVGLLGWNFPFSSADFSIRTPF